MLRNGRVFRRMEGRQAQQGTEMKIRFSGNKGTINVTQYFKLFNYRNANVDTEQKKEILSNLLDEPALSFFVEECLDCEEWQQIERKLQDRFEGEKPKFEQLFTKNLQDFDNMREFFEYKTSIGRRLQLNDEIIIEALNGGLPIYLKRLAVMQEFETTEEWFRMMKKMHSQEEPQRPTQQTGRPKERPQQPWRSPGGFNTQQRPPEPWRRPNEYTQQRPQPWRRPSEYDDHQQPTRPWRDQQQRGNNYNTQRHS